MSGVFEKLADTPVIAAVRESKHLDQALESPVRFVFWNSCTRSREHELMAVSQFQ